jgi:hypothetical protein
MNLDLIQTSPWVSVLPTVEIQNLKKEQEVISLVKLLVKVTQQAIDSYENGQFSNLDALVGNYGCETHAFNVLSLASSEEIKEECKDLRATCDKIWKYVEGREAIKAKLRKLADFQSEIQEICSISERMKYLIQSRLLTITKMTQYDERGYPTQDITQYTHLAKGVNVNVQKLLKPIGELAKRSMSENSIVFMRKRLGELGIAQGEEVVQKMMAEENIHWHDSKAHSCCYYNTKALLLLLAELKAPLIIKKMTKKEQPSQFYVFRSTGEFGKFELMTDICHPNTPVVTCAAFLPDDLSPEEWLEKVHHYGLGNLILAGGAEGPKYFPKEIDGLKIPLKEAEEEILFQRDKGKEMEGVLKLEHFYCSGFGEAGAT